MDSSVRLQEIENKIHKLAEQLQDLKAENERLHTENVQLKQTIDLLENKTVKELEEQITITRRQLDEERGRNPEAMNRLRGEIDHYIKEIDKCIEWLAEQ